MIKQFKLYEIYRDYVYINSSTYNSKIKIVICGNSNYFQSLWAIKTMSRHNTLNIWRKGKNE